MAINRNINYINKDFADYRSQLINFSQTYFPNTYSDFDESSIGMMFIEQASYVGDVLSFYLDNQVQETYLQYARQNNNIFELAYMFNYKPKVTSLATVDIDFYQLLPAKTLLSTEIVPDYDYALFVGANTTVSTRLGGNYIIEDPIDFTVSSSQDDTDVSIAQISSGDPTYYLIKKTRKATSGTIQTETFTFGDFQEFPTVTINNGNIAQIIDIFDSDGNEYFEVDHLGQELVYQSIKNDNANDPNNYQESDDAPYLLQTKQVQRRFATRFKSESQLQIQFGSGNPSDTDEEVTPNPTNIGLGLPFERNKLTTAYSPTNFIFTNTYGVAPTNTTLTVRYLTGGGVTSNVPANSLVVPITSGVKFLASSLNSNTAQYIFDSFATNNPNAATGGQNGDTLLEIRENSLSNYGTQLRNVTADDYLIRALSMPPKYGGISKAFIQKPLVNNTGADLDLYVLTANTNGNLISTSTALKNNLKSYLNQYRMIGDTISIKDGFVVNIGVEFEVIISPNYNNNEVLNACISRLIEFFLISNWQINQPIIMRDLYSIIDNIPGTQSVKNVMIVNKTGTNTGYSEYAYDIDGATQNGVIYPSLDPCIFEVKYPSDDIKGRIVTL
jgi:hypothetical protein|tara:strand:- start:2445 stop:4286 length:1842 start_codon:yes stop_codon:yes gene_type:complete